NWYNPLNEVAINGAPLSPHILYNPAVWDYGTNVAQGVGISYMNSTNGGIYWQGDFSNPNADPMARIPNIGRDAVANNATWGNPGYKVLSHDAVRSFNGEVVIAFTGLKFEEAKVDYDIWISKSNTSTMWDLNGRYNRATIDGIDEMHPSITQTVTPDHTLMIIYEAEGSHPSGALHVTYSKDEGNTWREPESVTTTPPFAEYRVFPILGFSLLVLKDYPNIVLKSLISVGPAITPHFEGGFAYSFMAQYAFYAIPSLSIKQQSVSALTANQGYVSSVSTSGATKVSAGDISAHSGLVESVGGTLTTGGGDLSYQGELVGSFANLTVAGGGSAISYVATTTYKPIVVYDAPIVTEEEGITGYGGNLLAYSADATGTDDPSSDQNTGSGATTGMSLAAGFSGREDFHSTEKDRDRGYYNNIFFGMNPSSNFTKFDFKEARAISTGDSDKDFRREIAIASGSRAYLVEVSRTGGNNDEKFQVLDYYQAWQSDPLVTETTDIELFDANGNGMDELIVSCTKGNVYSFEGMVTDPPETDFNFIDWDMVWEDDSYLGYFQDSVPKYQNILVNTDVNKDGIDDVLIGKMDPNVGSKGYEGYPLIQALNGATGEEFWIFNLTSSQYPLSKNSSIIYMMGNDLNADGFEDLVFFAYDYNGNELFLYGLIIEESGPTEAWDPVFFDDIIGNEITEFTLADIDGDSRLDILTAISNSVYFVDNYGNELNNGPLYFHTVEDASWTVEHISVGNNTLLLTSRNSTSGHVTYIDFNGTVIHEWTLNDTEFGLTAVQMPLTEDDHEDILILESGVVFAFDGLINISDQLWNKSLDNAIGNYEDAFRYDFNGDSFDDIMFQTMGTSGNYTSTFEEFSNFERIAYKIEGLTFSNLNNSVFQGWTALNYSGSGIVTPHSGDMMIGTVETDNFIEIESGAYRVSAWFGTDNLYANDFVWTAYDKFGIFITNTTFPSNMPIVFAELADPLGRIHIVKVTGSAGPGFESHWVMDDFSYESFGPTRIIALNGINYDDQLWEYYIWNTYATFFTQGDMDRDGEEDDLLFLTEYQGENYKHTGAMTVIDGTYGTPLTHIGFRGTASSAVLGNFGEFGEIAVTGPYGQIIMVTYVRHEPTFFRNIAVQMDDSISFETLGAVTRMAVGDFNNDGLEDVVFGDRARYLIAINGQDGQMIWKYRVSHPITKIAVSDFHLHDGFTDIAVTLISGHLVMINGETGRRLWDDYLGPVIVNDMKFVDQNQDGIVEELAISMGFRFTSFWGRFVLYNATIDTSSGHGTIIWEKYNPFRPFTRFEAADFSGDGTLDFAVAIYEHSMWILDGGSGGYLRVFPIAVQDFAVGDFNGNPLPMLAIIIRNGTVVTYESNDWTSGVTQSAKMNLDIPFRLSNLEIGDLTGDGLDEIIVRSFGNGTYALNGKLTKVLWSFEDRSIFYLPKYLIADMNNDSLVDVLSLNYDNILALDGTQGDVVWVSFVATHLITTMTLADFNNDGTMDVAVGTADGWVYILTGKSEVIIPQNAEIQEKQDLTSQSEIADSPAVNSPPILSTGNPIAINIVLMSFLLLIGLTIPVSSLFQRRNP
ncbi:MAG: FG-GAP repeat domain-containing protein, partial [Candidatus Hodarchaeales archaeon]